MALSTQDRAVLAHVVMDPDGWWAHAVSTLGETKAAQALAQKVARWKPHYEAALDGKEIVKERAVVGDEEVITEKRKDIPGFTEYQTRAEREASLEAR